MRGLMALSSSARFIGVWPTMAVKGNRGSRPAGAVDSVVIRSSEPYAARYAVARAGVWG